MTELSDEKNMKMMTSQDTMQLVWLLVGGGTLGSIYLIIKRNRSFFSWLIPVGMIVSGIGLYMNERQKLIRQTGDQIMSQLDELDPIARAQVVAYVGEQEIDKVS
jgi:Ni,Fe-hydrogenase I cytochrome b subunit